MRNVFLSHGNRLKGQKNAHNPKGIVYIMGKSDLRSVSCLLGVNVQLNKGQKVVSPKQFGP